ncbi:hypothetical protein ONZ45_g10558 [Pleurotus djamor]|nr:hypothetical protein ONZ45_g10558 [Pleurotus djamor]
MARTKQTASKSVDGTAPRKAPSTATLTAASSKVQKTASVAAKKASLQKASMRPYMLDPPKEVHKSSLCTGCQNGGDVICCSVCDQWMCYVVVPPRDDGLFIEDPTANGCLQITSEAEAEEHDFVCPRWHNDRDAAHIPPVKTSYYGFYDKAQNPVKDLVVAVRRTGSVFFAPINTPTTVLLFLALEGCETMDQPMIDAHSYLEPYFGRDGGQLLTFSIFFNSNKRGDTEYKRQLAGVIKAVKGDATKQVIVIFMTHVGEGGCLQHAPVVHDKDGKVIDPGASYDPQEANLMQPMKKKDRSTLMFFVCKGIDGHEQTRDWMLDSVNKGCFKEIFSFTNQSFQPSIARTFVGNYLVQSYVRCSPFPVSIPTILGGSLFLGESSDMVLIARDPKRRGRMLAMRFYWAQAKSSPYGVTLPTMCPICRCVRSLKIEVVKTRGGKPDPPRFPPGQKRPRTPEAESDVDVDEHIWRPGRDEMRAPAKVHWLLKVPINSKVKVVIRGTTEGDVNGVHRAAYRAGRYEGMEGTVVVTKALVDERSSVNVRVQDQTNRLFKIMYLDPLQKPSIFIVAARVVIIGPDIEGDTVHEGKYGFVSACAYPLAERTRLLFMQPNLWGYYDIGSLCFSGDIAEWQGGLH